MLGLGVARHGLVEVCESQRSLSARDTAAQLPSCMGHILSPSLSGNVGSPAAEKVSRTLKNQETGLKAK